MHNIFGFLTATTLLAFMAANPALARDDGGFTRTAKAGVAPAALSDTPQAMMARQSQKTSLTADDVQEIMPAAGEEEDVTPEPSLVPDNTAAAQDADTAQPASK